MYTKRRNRNKNRKTHKHHKHNKADKYHNNDNYKKLQCSPDVNNKNYTCYNNDNLEKMRKLWNARHPERIISSNDPIEIWSKLKENIGSACNKESCWLKQKFMEGNISRDLLNYTFSPKSPDSWKTNKNEWLSSDDILKVMKQYEKFYKCFEFLGPSPIDFDHHKLYGECVWEELCKININNMIKRHKNKIGIILNTDPHYKDGEHWISLFVNIKQKYIIYFDSNGNNPPKEVTSLIEKISNQGKQIGINFDILINKLEHQQTDSECGMYSLYFIIEMLKDTDKKYFINNIIKDEEVFKLRKKYFNEN
jgi:hypothetical protein